MDSSSNLLNLILGSGSALSAANDYRKQANDLGGLYTQDSPYAQMLQQQLQRQDAARGRRSQYGQRAVELQAKLADVNSRNAQQRAALATQQHQAVNSALKDAVSWYGSGGKQDINSLVDMYRRRFNTPQQYEASNSFVGPHNAPTNDMSMNDAANTFWGDGSTPTSSASTFQPGYDAAGEASAASGGSGTFTPGVDVMGEGSSAAGLNSATAASNPFMTMLDYAGYIPAGVNAKRKFEQYGERGDVGGQLGTAAGTIGGATLGPLGSLFGSQFGGQIGSMASKGAATLDDTAHSIVNGVGGAINDAGNTLGSIFGW